MKTEEAILIITQELFKREIESVEEIFANKSKLKNDLEYNNQVINASLQAFFDSASEILQNVIDANLRTYLEVPRFLKMNLENYNETFNHNLQVLVGSRRLLNFIN